MASTADDTDYFVFTSESGNTPVKRQMDDGILRTIKLGLHR
jgi:hypothetical protein